MKLLFKSVFLIFLWLTTSLTYAQSYTEKHYVTQNGAGSKTGRTLSNSWALADFHNTNNWSTNKSIDNKIGPNDVVYLSGNFSQRVAVKKGGASVGSITIDGYEAGDCDPLNTVCTGSALLGRGMEVYYPASNVTIQDFRMTTPIEQLNAFVALGTRNNDIERFIFRRNYVYEAGDRLAYFGYMRYAIIDGNKFYGAGHADHVWPDQNTYLETAVSLVAVRNSVFSNNEAAHDGTPIREAPHGNAELVALHGCHNLLIEYNNLHSSPGQTCLRPKEGWGGITNIVTRFNKIHSGATDNMHIQTDAISPHDGHYIYGNYFFNARFWGLGIGRNISNVYAWSNIFSGNGRGGFIVWWTSNNIHAYNNTFAYNQTWDETEGNLVRGGLAFTNGSGFYVKNNIFWNNRPTGQRERLQIYSSQNINALEHNSFYHSLGVPMFYYAGGYRTLATMKSTYGHESVSLAGVIKDPVFTDPNGVDKIYGTEDDNYTLQAGSPVIGSGAQIPGRFSVNVSGGNAWFEAQTGISTITFGFYVGLHPSTDWSGQPSAKKIITADRRDHGSGWERGAYVFKNNSLQVPKNVMVSSSE